MISGQYSEVPVSGKGVRLLKKEGVWSLQFDPKNASIYQGRMNGIKIYKKGVPENDGLVYEVGAETQMPLRPEELKNCVLGIW